MRHMGARNLRPPVRLGVRPALTLRGIETSEAPPSPFIAVAGIDLAAAGAYDQGVRGNGVCQHRVGFAVGLIGLTATVVVVLSAQVASGRTGASCNDTTNSAQFTFDDPGLTVRMSGSYNDAFGAGAKIAATYKGKASGTPASGASSCTTSNDQFSSMGIELGDRNDQARLNAKKPASLDSQATDPIPSFVAVTIDGNGGDDVLRGHKGLDTMFGRGGGDVIRVAGGGADSADCGPGHDKAITSGADTTTDCETVVAR